MKYNNKTHSYRDEPRIVTHLGNMRGVHNDKIANAQPDGLFIWILVFGVVAALLCRQAPEELARHFTPPLSDSAFVCVMGQCL